MKIEVKKIRNVKKEGTVRGIVNVLVDDCIAINDLQIISANDKIFVSFPSRKDLHDSTKYFGLIYPTNNKAREMFEKVILDEYNKMLKEIN